MTSINTELETALNELGYQPGVTPDDVARLRRVILADAPLIEHLNAHVVGGRLNGFKVAAAGIADAPMGSFDSASRMMILPEASLKSGGSDLAATIRLQEAIVTFSNKAYTPKSSHAVLPTEEMIRNLQTVINESPYLVQSIKRQMSEHDPADPSNYYLKGFAILSPKAGAGGTFDRSTHSMNLPADALRANSAASPNGYFTPDDLTFLIGHELQHGFNHPQAARATGALVDSAMAVARSKDRVHDYTDVVGNYIASSRVDEAKAEIAGWNALLSRKQQLNPSIGWEEMVRSPADQLKDFVYRDDATGETKHRDGLTFESDGSLAQSPGNIEAMGRNYFDKPAKRYALEGERYMQLGREGAGDYRAHYARTPINMISQVEDGARVIRGVHSIPQIDMRKLGLHEDLLEEQGLDLGKNTNPRLYLDGSDMPASRHYFDHTIEGSDHPFQYVPDPPAEMTSSLHRELKDLLPDGTSGDRIAQIALAAKEGGIEVGRIRSLDITGEKLMLTGATPGTSATIDLTSSPPPAAQSNAQFAAVTEQQQLQVQQQVSQQQSGLTMSMGR